MKGKWRKTLLTVAATTLLTVACGFGFTACKEEPTNQPTPTPITFENFEDEEQAVLLDETFVLPESTVCDTDGKEYTINYSVVTESGKTVGVMDGVVWIKSLETHYVHCQVDVEGSQTYKRTIKLTVKDEVAPKIKFGTFNDGYEGETYLLPQIQVSDSSGEEITPELKIYLLNGDKKGAEIDCSLTSFTPHVAGYYLLEATATDSSGNTATETEVVRIRPQTAKTTVLSFDSPTDVDKIGYPGNNTRELLDKNWLPEFAGEKNVIQLSFSGDVWAPLFTFTPLQNLSSASSTLFDEYDYLILRLYVVKNAEYPNAWHTVKYSNSATAVTPGFNQWVDYKYPLSAFADAATDGTAKFFEGSSVDELRDPETNAKIHSKGMFYIGGIYAANEATVSVSNVENSSEVEISAKDKNGEAIDLTKGTVRVVSPEGTVRTVTDGKFTPTSQGRYTVYVQGEGYWGKTVGDPSEILSFDYERDVAAYVHMIRNDPQTKEWLAEYQGERGVMKVTYNTGTRWTPAFTISAPLQNIHAITGYTHVVVRMYVVQSDTVKNVWNTVGMQTTSQVSSVAFEANKWVDYKFTVEQLQADGANVGQIKICGDAGNLTYDDYAQGAPEKTGEFYVAGIFLVKE